MDGEEPEEAGEPIHIANAGLVIVAAFLPQLFERLDALEQTEGGKRIVRPDAVSRLVHLLQYLVDGRTDTPEPLLCLEQAAVRGGIRYAGRARRSNRHHTSGSCATRCSQQ